MSANFLISQFRFMIFSFLLLISSFLHATDYPASLFGIRSDGTTLNTRSIQYAIDYINKQGGGRLIFEVGHYLTGSIHLKSNTTLHLKEGAVLEASLNPFDYDKGIFMGFILADDQQNISITGKGIIEGRGRQVAQNIITLIHNGIINDPLAHDRPQESNRPMLIYFRNCSAITIKGITFSNSACWVRTYDQCKQLTIDSITVDSKAYWNNDGIDIVDCDGVRITNSYIDAADDGICLKSHETGKKCNDIFISHNTIRSSASAIKFGTASHGGFSHIRIISNKVFNTYRSALALEAVDGGFIEDVVVDDLQAIHTGNALFLRIGDRHHTGTSRLQDIHISNLTVEIAADKPDAGYDYEGPVEHQPRNISPMVIAGLPGMLIENITLSNVIVSYPGGGNPMIAQRSLTQLDSIPNLPLEYPEFSMFNELPAWGLYIRHAHNLKIDNLQLSLAKNDYRPAIVIDDVHDIIFTHFPKNKKIYIYKSTIIRNKE